MRTIKLALFAGILFVLANRCAMAADYSITVPKELYSALLDYAFLGLSAMTAWAIKRGADLFGVRRESLLVERLEQGMTFALMYAREKALMKGDTLTDFQTRSQLVAVAAGYLLPKMPDLLKDLKIDAESLRERLTGRLDLVAPLDPHAATPPLG